MIQQTSRSLHPDWQIGDSTIWIGDPDLQVGHNDVNPTQRGRKVRAGAPSSVRPRMIPRSARVRRS